MRVNATLIVASLAIVENVTSAPIRLPHDRRSYVEELVRREEVSELSKREPLSPAMIKQSMQIAPLKKWFVLTLGSIGGVFALAGPESWTTRSVRKGNNEKDETSSSSSSKSSNTGTTPVQPAQPYPPQYRMPYGYNPGYNPYANYNAGGGGGGGRSYRRGVDDDLEPAEAKSPEKRTQALVSRGIGTELMNKYQWVFDGGFIGLTAWEAIRGIRYLTGSPPKDQPKPKKPVPGQYPGGQSPWYQNPFQNGGRFPVQGGGGYPVQGGGFQVGVGGSTGVSVSTGGGGVATTRYSRRDADDEIVAKLAPSKKEQSTLVARKEEKLANRGLLTWAAASTGIATLFSLGFRPFITQRYPENEKYNTELGKAQTKTAPRQPTGLEDEQRRYFLKYNQWQYLSQPNQERVVLPQFNGK